MITSAATGGAAGGGGNGVQNIRRRTQREQPASQAGQRNTKPSNIPDNKWWCPDWVIRAGPRIGLPYSLLHKASLFSNISAQYCVTERIWDMYHPGAVPFVGGSCVSAGAPQIGWRGGVSPNRSFFA